MTVEETNPICGYYECSICGHVTQVVKPLQIEVEDEYGNIEVIDTVELDGDASIELVIKHEETHKKTVDK